jgi:hypothetical protein
MRTQFHWRLYAKIILTSMPARSILAWRQPVAARIRYTLVFTLFYLFQIGLVSAHGTLSGSTDENSSAFDVDSALHWLSEQQDVSGLISSNQEPVIDSVSTLTALELSVVRSETFIDKSLASSAVQSLQYLNTELLSRQLITDSYEDKAQAVSDLLSRQNLDGGFGDNVSYGSTVFDTVWALKALRAAGIQDTSIVSSALYFVKEAQRPDGAFQFGYTDQPSIFVTGLVLQVLQPYAFAYRVSDTLTPAKNYLVQNQSDGYWEDSNDTANALLGLIPLTPDTSELKSAITYLKDTQLADGSWGDVYTTSTVLMLDQLLQTVIAPQDPNLAQVNARFQDADTKQPIKGLNVLEISNLNGTILIDENGSLLVTNLEAGNIELEVSASGYPAIKLSTTLSAGQYTDFGTVELIRSNTSSSISGGVTDKLSGLPVIGARVSNNNGDSVLTNNTGEYALNILPGDSIITIEASGYTSISILVSAVSGQQYEFSPALSDALGNPDPVTRFIGNVVDTTTKQALSGVQVQILETGEWVTTDAAGEFSFEGIAGGQVTVQASINGYETVNFNVLITPESTTQVTDIQMPIEVVALASSVFGQIIDVDTGVGVVAATVSVGSLTAVTNQNGRYEINDIPVTEFTLGVSAGGYGYSSRAVSLTDFSAVEVNLDMQRVNAGGVQLDLITSNKSEYGAYDSIEVTSTITNQTVRERAVRLSIRITDAAGKTLKEYLAKHVHHPDAINTPEAQAEYEQALQESLTVLQSNESISVVADTSWFTGNHIPGDYFVSVDVLDGSTSQVLSTLSQPIVILATESISQLVMSPTPDFALVNSTHDISFNLFISNKSNVDFTLAIEYWLLDSDGNELYRNTHQSLIDYKTGNTDLPLSGLSHQFLQSGNYTVAYRILSGPIPGVSKVSDVFVPPSLRLEVKQALSDKKVIPENGQTIRFTVELIGKEGE